MVIDQADIELFATILRKAAWVFLYFFLGFGPGFIAGILVANRIWGRGQPTLMNVQEEAMAAAAEHNKLFDPKHPRWQKS